MSVGLVFGGVLMLYLVGVAVYLMLRGNPSVLPPFLCGICRRECLSLLVNSYNGHGVYVDHNHQLCMQCERAWLERVVDGKYRKSIAIEWPL
jgi:hypothetical protein